MKKIQELVFLGASTAFLEILDIVNDINKNGLRYKVIAILDDNDKLHGTEIEGIKVEGPLSFVEKYPRAKFVFGIGSIKTKSIRMQILNKLNLPAERFVTLIHPNTKIYPNAKIGYGCVIHFGSVIGANTVIEDFTIIAFHSIIGNYVKIGKGSMITSSVTILSMVEVGECVFIGSGSCLAEGINIGSNAMVGMGTVLARDVTAEEFVVGNPPRNLGKADIWLKKLGGSGNNEQK